MVGSCIAQTDEAKITPVRLNQANNSTMISRYAVTYCGADEQAKQPLYTKINISSINSNIIKQ